MDLVGRIGSFRFFIRPPDHDEMVVVPLDASASEGARWRDQRVPPAA
jgi:hypothetical protein